MARFSLSMCYNLIVIERPLLLLHVGGYESSSHNGDCCVNVNECVHAYTAQEKKCYLNLNSQSQTELRIGLLEQQHRVTFRSCRQFFFESFTN